MRANLMQVTKHVIERLLLNTVLVVAILSVLGCGPPGTAPRKGAETPSAPVEGTPLSYEAVLCVNEARINVLFADTPQERAAGLSGYPGLPEDAGMLFVFPEPRQPSFWMRGVLFALDLIWIRDGMVVQINASVPPPPPNTPDDQLPRYQPTEPITHVLELAAGSAARYGITVGDRVIHCTDATLTPPRCRQDRTDAIAASNRAILQRATTSNWIELRASTPMA